MKEIWKDIPNYEGLYQISNYGRVKTLEKSIKCGLYNNKIVKRKEKIKKIQANRLGYYHTVLGKNGKCYNVNIHRLVAEVFLEKNNFKYMPNENLKNIDISKLVVNHIDENPSNNYVDNLEWCTQAYNINYGHRNKKVAKNMIENKRYSKDIIQYSLNGDVIKIWRSLKEIQNTLGYSRKSIALCCKKESKQSHGYIWRYYES